MLINEWIRSKKIRYVLDWVHLILLLIILLIQNNSEIFYFFQNCFIFTYLKFCGIFFIGVTMNGEHLESLQDLRRCFCIDELIYDYISGELEIWLRKIGETEKAGRISKISKVNAYILLKLYEILDLNPDLSEKEIRSFFTLRRQNE